MEDTKEKLKTQANQIKAQMDRIAREISDLKADNISTYEENTQVDKKENTKPIFNIPDDITAEAPHFEKVHRDTDDEHEPMGDKEGRKSIAELEAKLEKARLDYFKKSKEQNSIKKLTKKIGQGITFGYYKPDFVKAKGNYEDQKRELNSRKYSEKAKNLLLDNTKTQEERGRILANFKADLTTEESAEISKLLNARAEALSERRKILKEEALKTTLSTLNTGWKASVGAFKGLKAIDKKVFHRGSILIDKRGAKPANADEMISQANLKLSQVEGLVILAKEEKNKEARKEILDGIKQLKKDAEELKDKAKGEIIYQYRLGQLARSGALLGVGGLLAGGIGAAQATLWGVRVFRGVGIGMVGATALANNEKVMQSKLCKHEKAKAKLENDFAGRTDAKEYVDGIKSLEKKKKMAKILHNSMKGVIVGLMATSNMAMGSGKILGHDIHWGEHHLGQNIDTSIAKGTTEIFNGAKDGINDLFSDNGVSTNSQEATVISNETQTLKDPQSNTNTETSPAEKLVDVENTNQAKIKPFEVQVSSRGAFATVENLKMQLDNQYKGIAPEQIPANVQHILDTKTVELTKEWGMFNPDSIDHPEGKESAMMLAGKGDDVSELRVGSDGKITLYNFDKGETVLSGEGAETYKGEMFDSDNHSASGKVDINQVPEGEEGYTKLTEGDVNINETPDGLDAGDVDKPPYYDGLPMDKSELDQTVWEKSNIHIRGNAYEDATGNIVRLDGKEITLGSDHKIYVDGTVSEYLTKELSFEKSKILDSTFTRNFAWTRDGAKSPEWIRLQNYNMETLKNPPTDSFLNDKETKFISKLLKVAKRNGVDYHGKTANQLVEAIAINKLG